MYTSSTSNFHIFLKKSVRLDNITATDISMRTYDIRLLQACKFAVLVC